MRQRFQVQNKIYFREALLLFTLYRHSCSSIQNFSQTKHLFRVPRFNFPPLHYNLLSGSEILCSLTNTRPNEQKLNMLGSENQSDSFRAVITRLNSTGSPAVLTLRCRGARRGPSVIEPIQEVSQHRCHSEKLQRTASGKTGHGLFSPASTAVTRMTRYIFWAQSILLAM